MLLEAENCVHEMNIKLSAAEKHQATAISVAQLQQQIAFEKETSQLLNEKVSTLGRRLEDALNEAQNYRCRVEGAERERDQCIERLIKVKEDQVLMMDQANDMQFEAQKMKEKYEEMVKEEGKKRPFFGKRMLGQVNTESKEYQLSQANL